MPILCLDPENFSSTIAEKKVVVIDRQDVVRHAVYNDPALGRSVSETLRMLDALCF
jgi:alkyl hydroperoxide reductase subunit AhpC